MPTYLEQLTRNDMHCLNVLSSGLSVLPDGAIINRKTGKPVPPQKSIFGYLRIRFEKRFYAAHRVVLIAFKGLPPEGCPETHHRDGCRTNNAISNLEWVSRLQNMSDTKKGRTKRLFTDSEVSDIRTLHSEGVSICELSRRFGASVQVIRERLREDYLVSLPPQHFEDEIIELRKKGLSYRAIEQELGLNDRAVYGFFRKRRDEENSKSN